MQYRYSVLIQWSELDHKYLVTLPEWGPYAHTDGNTYQEAAAMAEETLAALLEGAERPPVPALFPDGGRSPEWLLALGQGPLRSVAMDEHGELVDLDDLLARPATFRQRWYGRFYRARMWPVQRWRDLCAFWQRGCRGWADRDTWNADSYYARVIGESLAYLAEHAHGHPVEFRDSGAWRDYQRRLALAFLDYALASEEMRLGWDAYPHLLAQMRCLFDHFYHLND